jgi:hypothetical protein
MLVVEPEKLFEKCIIGTGLSKQNMSFSKPPEKLAEQLDESVDAPKENITTTLDEVIQDSEETLQVQDFPETDEPNKNLEESDTPLTIESDSTLIEIVDDNFPLEMKELLKNSKNVILIIIFFLHSLLLEYMLEYNQTII